MGLATGHLNARALGRSGARTPDAMFERAVSREGATVIGEPLAVEGGCLRVLRIRPRPPSVGPSLVFVPGWASTPATWRLMIAAIARERECLYVETREKSTATLSRNAGQEIRTAANDIAIACRRMPGPYVLAGASTGANLILTAEADLGPQCVGVALLAPHVRVPIPWWVGALRFVPSPVIGVARRALLAVAYRRSPRKLEASQYAGLLAAASAADVSRLARSARAWRRYRVDHEEIAAIARPALIVRSLSDTFHSADDAASIGASFAFGQALRVPNFAALHSRQTAMAVLRWADTLSPPATERETSGDRAGA